jgi:uncharacterized protein YndB with AHSA1/START domain
MTSANNRSKHQEMIEIERRIAASPETVFAYFTDPERYRLWLGVDAEVDARPGGMFRVTVTGRSGMVARGHYVEVDPPRRVMFTWGWEENNSLADTPWTLPPGSSTVEVVLTPDGETTVLQLRHTGLPTASCPFHQLGWDVTVDRLSAVAAGRDTGPHPLAEFSPSETRTGQPVSHAWYHEKGKAV